MQEEEEKEPVPVDEDEEVERVLDTVVGKRIICPGCKADVKVVGAYTTETEVTRYYQDWDEKEQEFTPRLPGVHRDTEYVEWYCNGCGGGISDQNVTE